MKALRIGTVFIGIGAPEQALFRMGIKNKIVFACDDREIELKESVENIKKMIAWKFDRERQISPRVSILLNSNRI